MTAIFTLLSLIVIVAMVSVGMGLPLSPLQSGMDNTAPKSGDRRQLQVQRAIQNREARMERFASLPDDQRQFMSKQLLQALSEIIQREDCFSDYQGWVDFGRRSTD
ncbi:gastrin/cholecystokinin-like peptide [Trichomycterus rosablanca]|uniref:gastrin/cholecystokinin-like peptide n=1 Tax=Trichomycterus rosablanca TaxID=2290929 RepID=UPI002F35C948